MTSIVATVTKESKEQKCGIGLTNKNPGKGPAMVTNIAEDGLFAGSPLVVGMEVKTINDKHVANSSEAIAVLKEAEGQITVVADVVETPTPTAGKASAAPTSASVAMISSEDGVAITRDMPSILNNYMPATYWNTFCDELDEALKPVADAKKILGWIDMISLTTVVFDIVFLVLAFVNSAMSSVWWILLVVNLVIQIALAYYCYSKAKATAQIVSKEMKEICSRATKQYPAVVLNVEFEKEVLRRFTEFSCDIRLAKNMFNDLDYIEVSIQAVEP